MSATTASIQPSFQPPVFWQRLVNTNRFLALNIIFYLALFAITVVASFVDTRLVTGAPVWFKPIKFAISSALYTVTLLWMLSFVQGKRRLVNIVAIGTSIGFLVELGVIYLQAARGIASHFNVSTELNAVLFSLMGIFVLVIWAMNLLAAGLLLFQRLPDSAFAWSLRLALILTVIGAGLGFLMTQPTAEQLAALESGQTASAIGTIGAHNVGVRDGGPGLPFTGWSTEGGDLRIPHFVGLHALQMVPLMGLLIRRRWGKQLSMARRTSLVWIGSLGYLGLILLLTWQALRGQSIIAPDAATWIALASLIGITALAGWLVVTSAGIPNKEQQMVAQHIG